MVMRLAVCIMGLAGTPTVVLSGRSWCGILSIRVVLTRIRCKLRLIFGLALLLLIRTLIVSFRRIPLVILIAILRYGCLMVVTRRYILKRNLIVIGSRFRRFL